MTFKGSVYYWVPGAFPIIPWYSWPFGWSTVVDGLAEHERCQPNNQQPVAASIKATAGAHLTLGQVVSSQSLID
jgi:hypothetical protein